MIVALVSGSCGTGRTTVAANLALVLKDRFSVTLLDCDVEQPNTALLPINWQEKTAVTINAPKIRFANCSRCFNCVKNCRFGAFIQFKNSIVVLPERCANCGVCSSFCVGHAISLEPYTLGYIRRGDYHGLNVVEARIDNSAVKAAFLIKRIRSYIDPYGLNIVDCAPDISDYDSCSTLCPDFILIVTGDSKQERKWLTKAIHHSRNINRPFGVLLNMASNNQSSYIEEYCQEEGIPYLGSLPYDELLASGLINNYQLASHSTTWRERFEQLWESILDLASQ